MLAFITRRAFLPFLLAVHGGLINGKCIIIVLTLDGDDSHIAKNGTNQVRVRSVNYPN